MSGQPYIQLGAVRLSQGNAAEMDGERPLISIPRDQILGIEICHGSGAERPLVSLVVGVALVILAILPIVGLWKTLKYGGAYVVNLAGMFALIIPAVWLLNLSLRKRCFLRVKTPRGSRKLLFAPTIERIEVERFVAEARTRFGYL